MFTDSTCPDSTCKYRNRLGYCTVTVCVAVSKSVAIWEQTKTPTIEAVPLDKLCEWLPNAVHSCPANPEGHNEKCEHMKCEECWKEAICNWMEEDNANQT